ncbi:hypothetical protein, partial [Mesorhizobium sp.]
MAEAVGTVIIYCGSRKKYVTTSKTVRIAVDSALALDQYFFEARKKASSPSGQSGSRREGRREDIMKRFA